MLTVLFSKNWSEKKNRKIGIAILHNPASLSNSWAKKISHIPRIRVRKSSQRSPFALRECLNSPPTTWEIGQKLLPNLG